jgi:hypothetical protein
MSDLDSANQKDRLFLPYGDKHGLLDFVSISHLGFQLFNF